MSQTIIADIEKQQLKTDLPNVEVGDTVHVHVRIIEGAKERVQVFSGVVIARKGSGLNETITVRRIVANQGVERVFPIHSPRIAKIEVKHRGHTRRAKLYYLRERVGKKRRLQDRRRGLAHLYGKPAAQAEPATAENLTEEDVADLSEETVEATEGEESSEQ